MQDFEKLGAFYLGRIFDPATQKTQDDLLLYDAKDLTTHALCVGMTGSGKTGLCLTLLEEAAIDGIPAIIIDPKGDLGNLLLTFPELKPENFLPWVDAGEATRKGMTVQQLAAQKAKMWREGLADWGQDPERIARFRDSVDVAIYTPGSNAGLPLTVLRSFAAPPAAVLESTDALRERIMSAVSGLLALLGIQADPLRSREHILLSMILETAWRGGQNVDMGKLIRDIQTPPFDKVGFLDLESFFPAKERFELSLSLNNLLASPGFSTWMEGTPLDVQRLLHTPEGKPRLSILSIAHLSDTERMFFVTILLNEVIAWMRSQSGTSSLRALLYMDEVFGYFPPVANPPCKQPMLTLLKQARAYGLGVVLATQNPVDLDYKGLANTGTWLLGRLQTERDKARVLDGLEGASTTAGKSFDRQNMESLLSGLSSRVFLMNNVHDDEPVLFQTRWALSYLSGPMTREQIRTLMEDRRAATAANSRAGDPGKLTASVMAAASTARPVLPPGIEETFLLRRGVLPAGSRLVYQPMLVGTARVHFVKASRSLDVWESVTLLSDVSEDPLETLWGDADVSNEELEQESLPENGAQFATLPSVMTQAKTYSKLGTELKNHLYRAHKLTLFSAPALKMVSEPGESEGDFRVRLKQDAYEKRDLAIEKLRSSFGPKLATLQERLRRAEQKVEKEKSQATQKTLQAAITMGSSILSAMFGRKLASSTNVGRAATSMRAAGRIASERQDVGQALETVEAVKQKIVDLETNFKKETETLQSEWDIDAIELESVSFEPRKSDINIISVTLAWQPTVVSGEA